MVVGLAPLIAGKRGGACSELEWGCCVGCSFGILGWGGMNCDRGSLPVAAAACPDGLVPPVMCMRLASRPGRFSRERRQCHFATWMTATSELGQRPSPRYHHQQVRVLRTCRSLLRLLPAAWQAHACVSMPLFGRLRAGRLRHAPGVLGKKPFGALHRRRAVPAAARPDGWQGDSQSSTLAFQARQPAP